MYLSTMNIKGYKNFKEKFTINFNKNLNVIVGENGCGKSAVIDAIRLLLFEDEFGRSFIIDSDFNRPFEKDSVSAESIEIRTSFTDMSDKEKIAFLPWFDLNDNANLTLQIKNKTNNKGYYKRSLWGGASSAGIFEWELLDCFDCVYLPPLRDAESKLRNGRGSRLGRLLKKREKEILKENKKTGNLHPLEQKVKEFNDALVEDDSEPINKTNEEIKSNLKKALGGLFAQNTHIQFSETSFNRIVESLKLLFFPNLKVSPEIEDFRSLEENSLGYNNLLYLATVLAEFEMTEETDLIKILLIEEPEAHLHPQLQIKLLKYLKEASEKNNVQVIITTHSPVLSSAVSIEDIIHLSNLEYPKAISLNKCGLENSLPFINRWLDMTKSTLLFAKGVIFVEGIAEAMILPEMAKKVLLEYNSSMKGDNKLPISLEEAGVSIINMNGIYFKHFMQLFCNVDVKKSKYEYISVKCAGITDCDPKKETGEEGAKIPVKPTNSKKHEGLNHALKLIDDINKSEHCRLYANELKTFEYDLAMEGENIPIMLDILIELWAKDKGSVITKLENYKKNGWETDENKKADAAYGILKRIESSNIGKGIFAQVLADKISETSNELSIPQYINKAIIWSCGGLVEDK